MACVQLAQTLATIAILVEFSAQDVSKTLVCEDFIWIFKSVVILVLFPYMMLGFSLLSKFISLSIKKMFPLSSAPEVLESLFFSADGNLFFCQIKLAPL